MYPKIKTRWPWCSLLFLPVTIVFPFIVLVVTTYTDFFTSSPFHMPYQRNSILGNLTAPGSHLPDVIIYRRSKKTGSSSMLSALLEVTKPYQYIPIFFEPLRMLEVVRAENLKPSPRRLLTAQHSEITRSHVSPRRAVIIDTVMDGYSQITSYCRFFEGVQGCKGEMVKCLEDKRMREVIHYRWAGRNKEDEDTFIDLPLSSAHPALSSTLMRHVFPGVTLNVKKANVRGTTCPEDPLLRTTYNKWYRELDKQVDNLRKRMLAIAGYPLSAKEEFNITITELIDEVERIESLKYEFVEHEAIQKMTPDIRDLARKKGAWERLKDGKIVLQGKA